MSRIFHEREVTTERALEILFSRPSFLLLFAFEVITPEMLITLANKRSLNFLLRLNSAFETHIYALTAGEFDTEELMNLLQVMDIDKAFDAVIADSQPLPEFTF